MRIKLSQQQMVDLTNDAQRIDGIQIITAQVDVSSVDELKLMGEDLRNRLESGIGLLVAIIQEKLSFVCVVTDDLIKEKKIKAGDIVKQVAQIAGGSGGGRRTLHWQVLSR